MFTRSRCGERTAFLLDRISPGLPAGFFPDRVHLRACDNTDEFARVAARNPLDVE
jgi:hypothetical protein